MNAGLVHLYDLGGEKPAYGQQETANREKGKIDFSGEQPSAQKNGRHEHPKRENPLRVSPNARSTPPQDTLGERELQLPSTYRASSGSFCKTDAHEFPLNFLAKFAQPLPCNLSVKQKRPSEMVSSLKSKSVACLPIASKKKNRFFE